MFEVYRRYKQTLVSLSPSFHGACKLFYFFSIFIIFILILIFK
jgi:hypothetical protein